MQDENLLGPPRYQLSYCMANQGYQVLVPNSNETTSAVTEPTATIGDLSKLLPSFQPVGPRLESQKMQHFRVLSLHKQSWRQATGGGIRADKRQSTTKIQ